MTRTARRLRIGLVEELQARGVVRSRAVADALASVARELFIPEVLADEGLEAVYRDQAFVTKRDPCGMPLSSSSQPALMATMLELLDPRPGQRVLEIGTGTGYNAALLAHLVGPQGKVLSVDVAPDLARRARRALKQSGYRVRVVIGDGRRGWLESAPYDRIIVTACADEVPRSWLEQLSDDGLLELPLRLDGDRAAIQVIPVLQRRGDRLRSIGLTWGGFMPLHGGDGGWHPPPTALTVTRARRETHTSLVSITGSALSALPDSAASELLTAALTHSRSPLRTGVVPMNSAEPPLLLIYLLLRIPASRRLAWHSNGAIGVGVIHRRTRSLAFVSMRSTWTQRAGRGSTQRRWRLDGYGGDGAAAELASLLDDWQAMRRSRRQTLRITAFGSSDPLRLRFGWS